MNRVLEIIAQEMKLITVTPKYKRTFLLHHLNESERNELSEFFKVLGQTLEWEEVAENYWKGSFDEMELLQRIKDKTFIPTTEADIKAYTPEGFDSPCHLHYGTQINGYPVLGADRQRVSHIIMKDEIEAWKKATFKSQRPCDWNEEYYTKMSEITSQDFKVINKCGNRNCLNKEHLEVVARKQNTIDKATYRIRGIQEETPIDVSGIVDPCKLEQNVFYSFGKIEES